VPKILYVNLNKYSHHRTRAGFHIHKNMHVYQSQTISEITVMLGTLNAGAFFGPMFDLSRTVVSSSNHH